MTDPTEPQRRRMLAKLLEARQRVLCAAGVHDWTGWGDFTPVLPPFELITAPEPIDPTFRPVEAYRWRYCECGAAERETWHTRERQVFNAPTR
jgi:hypothetical protein